MGKKQILRAEIERTEDGIFLYLQSPVFDSLFKELSCTTFIGEEEHWKDTRVYNIPKNLKFRGLRLINSKCTLFRRNNRGINISNISYLRMVGLEDGKVIYIPGLFTQEEIKEYLTILRKRTEKLYTSLFSRVMSKDKKVKSRIGGGTRNEVHS